MPSRLPVPRLTHVAHQHAQAALEKKGFKVCEASALRDAAEASAAGFAPGSAKAAAIAGASAMGAGAAAGAAAGAGTGVGSAAAVAGAGAAFAAAKKALSSCALLVAVLTEDGPPGSAYFDRPDCLQDLRWALKQGTPVVPVARKDDAAPGRLEGLLGAAPGDVLAALLKSLVTSAAAPSAASFSAAASSAAAASSPAPAPSAAAVAGALRAGSLVPVDTADVYVFSMAVSALAAKRRQLDAAASVLAEAHVVAAGAASESHARSPAIAAAASAFRPPVSLGRRLWREVALPAALRRSYAIRASQVARFDPADLDGSDDGNDGDGSDGEDKDEDEHDERDFVSCHVRDADDE